MVQRTGLPERGSKENGWVYCRWKRSMRGVSGQIKRVRRSLQKEGLSPSSSSGLRFFMWISYYLINITDRGCHKEQLDSKSK